MWHLIQYKTSRASLHMCTWLMSQQLAAFTIPNTRTPRTAASSSSRGIDFVRSGATRHLAMTIATVVPLLLLLTAYTIAAIAASDASTNTWRSTVVPEFPYQRGMGMSFNCFRHSIHSSHALRQQLGISASHAVSVRHASRSRMRATTVMWAMSPNGSNGDMAIRSNCRFVGSLSRSIPFRILSTQHRKEKQSLEASQSRPSVPVELTSMMCSSSPSSARATDLSLDTNLCMWKPPLW